MLIFPAIDLFGGNAVRLYQGDYAQMTIYNHDPLAVARDFEAAGASWIHMVDLEGAREGTTPNLSVVERVAKETGLRVEVGGGIRSMAVVDAYFAAGVSRVILGTAAVTDPDFLRAAVAAHGEKIAVGVDLKDGFVAIRGWTETSQLEAFRFCRELHELGVGTVICTDISRDGAMQGANRELYRQLRQQFPGMQFIASGGVSSLEDVAALAAMDLYGAIIGKAYYTGAVKLSRAIEVAK